MNKLFISGRLTNELKFFPEKVGKDAMTSFTVVNNKKIDNKDYTLYMNCQLYGSKAAKASKELYKGVKVIVEGTLISTSDEFGNKGVKLLVKDYEIVEHTKAYLEQFGTKVNTNKLPDSLLEDEFMTVDPNEKLPWE